MNDRFITSREACKILGVTATTLRKMDKDKQIPTIRTSGNKRLYNVQSFIDANVSVKNPTQNKVSICYCRVSSNNQKDDL